MKIKLRLKKNNIITITLFITIWAVQGFAQLVPNFEYLGIGIFRVFDIGIVMAVAWTIWVYVSIRDRKKINYRYGRLVIMFFVMVFLSSCMSYIFFSQPVYGGLLTKRSILACFLLYFPITKCLQGGVLKKEDLRKILFTVGTIELMVYIIQFILVDVISFTYLDLTEVRYNTSRIRFPYLLQLILGLICLSDLLGHRCRSFKEKLIHLLYILGSIFLLAGICRHRAPTIILIGTIGIGYFLWKKNISIKMMAGTIILVVGIVIAGNSTFFLNTVDGIINRGGKNDTLTVRDSGRAYYISRIKESPLFGYGGAMISNKKAQLSAKSKKNYYLDDNGIVAFTYLHGLVGVGWLAIFFYKTYRLSYHLYKQKNKYEYLLYIIFETVNLYIGMHWYFHYPFPFVAMFTLLGDEIDHKESFNAKKICVRINSNIL